MALFTAFLGGIELLALGVLGEYLGRVLEQVKGRPSYIIRDSEGFTCSEPQSRAIRRHT